MMILYMAIVIAAAVIVCSIGLKNGLERVTKVMMLALLAIMVLLAINSFFVPGGEKGLAFYLMPDIDEVESAPWLFSEAISARKGPCSGNP